MLPCNVPDRHQKTGMLNYLYQRATVIRLCAAIVCVTSTWVDAASSYHLMTWTDPTPSSLTPFDGNAEATAGLAGSTILVYSQPSTTAVLPYNSGPGTYPHAQYVTGALVVDATPAQVENTLSNYTGYNQLFPKITAAQVLSTDKQGNWPSDQHAVIRNLVRYHILIKVPFPLLTLNEDLVMQHDRTHNSISTLIIDSPIQYGAGKFEWFPLKNGKTLVTLTQWADLEHPKGFLLNTVFKALPEIKLALPNSVDAYILQALRERFNHNTLPSPAPVNSVMPQMALSAQQEEQVLKLLKPGGIVQFGHPPVQLSRAGHADKLWFVSSYFKMPAPQARAHEALADPQTFARIYRQVRRVSTTPLSNGGMACDIKIGIGLGVLSIPVWTKLNYMPEPSTNSVHFYSTGGDVDWIQGRIGFKALSTDSTLVSMTSTGHLGEHPPFPLNLGMDIPYLDYLSTAGAAPVVFNKAKLWLDKNQSK